MTCGLEKGKLALYQPGSTTSSVPIHGTAIFLQPYHVPQVYSALSPSWLLRRLSLWYAPLTICLPTFSLTHWRPSNVFTTQSPTPGGRQNKWNKTKQTPKSMSIINSHNIFCRVMSSCSFYSVYLLRTASHRGPQILLFFPYQSTPTASEADSDHPPVSPWPQLLLCIWWLAEQQNWSLLVSASYWNGFLLISKLLDSLGFLFSSPFISFLYFILKFNVDHCWLCWLVILLFLKKCSYIYE